MVPPCCPACPEFTPLTSARALLVACLIQASTVESLSTQRFFGDRAGPWRPAVAARLGSVTRNLCKDGKLLPELYLLGAAKSATTTLAHYLRDAGVRCVHDQNTDKEFHYFDAHFRWDWSDPSGLEQRRRQWLTLMPRCPTAPSAAVPTSSTSKPRQLLADFTPANLRMVPLPARSHRFGRFPPWRRAYALGKVPKGGRAPVSLPPLLKQLYGKDAARLKFVVLLREPLARMQSAWYHARSTNFTNMCVDCRAASFESAVRKHLSEAQKDPPVYSDWLWTGMYARQLEEWLKYFEPAQFLLMPTRYLTRRGSKAAALSRTRHNASNSRLRTLLPSSLQRLVATATKVVEGHSNTGAAGLDTACHELVAHLDFAMDCDSRADRPLHRDWSHAHPRLTDDISPKLLQDFEKFMLPERKRLEELLAKAHKDGARLPGVHRGDGSAERVRLWLQDGW